MMSMDITHNHVLKPFGSNLTHDDVKLLFDFNEIGRRAMKNQSSNT